MCFVEGAAYECGQLSELDGSWCGEANCGMGAETRGAAVNVPPGHKCGSVGGCEGVQGGGGSRECREKKANRGPRLTPEGLQRQHELQK
jgi:hypothetical protein